MALLPVKTHPAVKTRQLARREPRADSVQRRRKMAAQLGERSLDRAGPREQRARSVALSKIDQARGESELRFGQPWALRYIARTAQLEGAFQVGACAARVALLLLCLAETQRGVGLETLEFVAQRRAQDFGERLPRSGFGVR